MRKSSLIHLTGDTGVGEPDATETGTSGSEGGGRKRAAPRYRLSETGRSKHEVAPRRPPTLLKERKKQDDML
jgi:hypothetical protein